MKGRYKDITYKAWLPDGGIFLSRITERQVTNTWKQIIEASVGLVPYRNEYLRECFETALKGSTFNKVSMNYQTFYWLSKESNAFSEPLSCVDFYFDNEMPDYKIVNLDDN